MENEQKESTAVIVAKRAIWLREKGISGDFIVPIATAGEVFKAAYYTACDVIGDLYSSKSWNRTVTDSETLEIVRIIMDIWKAGAKLEE